MSIAGDLLTTATPARLLCRRGTWVLELVKLVPVDRNVFQPRVQRLEGAEAVLQHLKRSGDNPALAAAAGQLMRAARSDEERAFDAVDGDWVPGELGPRRDGHRPSSMPPGSSHAGEVAELRAELLVLRASHERLRERVQRLEAQWSAAGRARDVLSVPPTPSFVMPKASDRAPGGARSRPPAAIRPTATRVSGEPSLAPTGLRLPSVATINESLHALIGDQASVREKRPVLFSPDTLGPCWVSRLIDDEGHDVGAIVADRAAAIALGGALMALPEHEIEAQRALATPSDDIVSAMSEVANNLCETINQHAGGLQVRVKPIEPLAPGSLDWAEKAASIAGSPANYKIARACYSCSRVESEPRCFAASAPRGRRAARRDAHALGVRDTHAAAAERNAIHRLLVDQVRVQAVGVADGAHRAAVFLGDHGQGFVLFGLVRGVLHRGTDQLVASERGVATPRRFLRERVPEAQMQVRGVTRRMANDGAQRALALKNLRKPGRIFADRQRVLLERLLQPVIEQDQVDVRLFDQRANERPQAVGNPDCRACRARTSACRLDSKS